MPRLNAANRARTTLAETISSQANSFSVVDASLFPNPPFLISVENEIMEVGSKSGDTFSDVLRGQEGTIAEEHAAGVSVENRLTAGMYNMLQTIRDIDTGTLYKYALQIHEGIVQLVYEEVV